MTREECRFQLHSLAKGFNVTLSSERVDAYFEKLTRYSPQAWQETVTILLCASQFPRSLEIILDAIEKVASNHRRTTIRADRICAPTILARAFSGPEFDAVLHDHANAGSVFAREWLARHSTIPLTHDLKGDYRERKPPEG